MNVLNHAQAGKTLRVGPIEITFGRDSVEVRLAGGTSVLIERVAVDKWLFEVATDREDHLPEYPAVPALDRDPRDYVAEGYGRTIPVRNDDLRNPEFPAVPGNLMRGAASHQRAAGPVAGSKTRGGALRPTRRGPVLSASSQSPVPNP